MREIMKSFPLALLFLFVIFCNPSHALLTDWELSLDGTQRNTISEYLDVTGSNFVRNTFAGDDPENNPDFTFENWGFLKSNSHDGGSSYLPTDYEFTGIFYGEGTGTLGDAANFDSGTLEIYVDNNINYSTETSNPTYYGSNDGKPIGIFNLTDGVVDVGDNAFPAGETALSFESTDLASGHWFDSNGNDLSNTTPIEWVIGLSTSTANQVSNPSDSLLNEMEDYSGFTWTDGENRPTEVKLSSNGQFRLAQVPEPTTMLLFGTGLLGLGIFGRRKFMKNKS